MSATTPATVWIEGGELWIADATRVVWHGRPAGKAAKLAVAVPDRTPDAIVVIASGVRRRWNELVRVGSDGQILWRAAPLPSDDEWIEVRCQEGFVFANTAGCFAVILDLHTGATLGKTFTK